MRFLGSQRCFVCFREFNWAIFKVCRAHQEISGVQVYRRHGLSVVAGHGRWSCDVVAMVKGGLGCGMAAPGGLVTYGEFSHCWNGDCKREEDVGPFDHLSLSCPQTYIFFAHDGKCDYTCKANFFLLHRENCSGRFSQINNFPSLVTVN